MKKLIIIIFLVFISCDTTENDHISCSNLLESSYVNNSLNELDQFIKKWKSDYPATNFNEIQNDTIKLVYSLFRKIYDPKDQIGDKEFESWNQYVIMNSNINILITDSLLSSTMFLVDSLSGGFITSWDIDELYKTYELEIHNFYPTLESGDRVLFMEDNYLRTISKFIPQIDYNNWDSDIETLKSEKAKKIKFLQQRINIGIWGNITYPRIYKCRLKSDLKEAYLEYSFPLAGYEAHLKNINSSWEIVEINSTWIE